MYMYNSLILQSEQETTLNLKIEKIVSILQLITVQSSNISYFLNFNLL